MAEFVAFEPTTEVLGQTLLSSIGAMGEQALPYLQQFKLENVQPEQWYLQQVWLDFMRTIGQKEYNGVFDLVGIGMQIPDRAIFPPAIDSIPSALASVDVAYHLNHRNGEIGHYHAHTIGENQIDMVCENPYPCDFDYGLIYGLVRRFRPSNVRFTVQHDDHAPCRQKGDQSCTYHVTWG